ncbi:hypothetical protein BZG36_01081 [Bifiguratus adelaidae]|uniref:Sodium/calcium exchanger membrane region domain-containing protein n=1 Tax=Bifiguratus adelaidae TaxID=1938954 RepID=A0A261Y640_9FUNG|nr:hypothetical protein BZG36_01081 [Bifiguratus adelaidae]
MTIRKQLQRVALLLCCFCVLTLSAGLVPQVSAHSSSHELLSRDAKHCENIHEQQDQCAFVVQECLDYSPGFISYLRIYFCASKVGKVFAFIGMSTWLLFLFGFVGIAAADFFCPNLQTIALSLHLSESIAGVTFLAFGNGSPDLFSTFSAFHAGSGSLAVGELIGAAFFISTIVAGSMAIIKPFQVNSFPFMRDLSFFTASIIIILIIVWDEKIYLFECIILVVFYALYVIAVVFGDYWWSRRTAYRALEQSVRDQYGDDDIETHRLMSSNRRAFVALRRLYRDSNNFSDDENEFEQAYGDLAALYGDGSIDNGSTLDSSAAFAPKMGIRPSLFGAIEFHDVVQSLQRSSVGYAGLDTGTHIDLEDMPDESRPSLDSFTEEDRHVSGEEFGGLRIGGGRLQGYITRAAEFLHFSESDAKHMTKALFPSMQRWRHKTVAGRISSIVAIPILLALTLTLPVVHDDSTSIPPPDSLADQNGDMMQTPQRRSKQKYWNKWLVALQMSLGMVWLGFVLQSTGAIPRLAILWFALSGLGSSILVIVSTNTAQPPIWHKFLCFVGFGIAISWIYVVASEVVGVLQTFGIVLNISDAILGLTIFAMGNCMGDLVADITMAKMGFPLMAMSAVFGTPMLNILIGIGISALIMTSSSGEPFPVKLSPVILISAGSLLLCLCSSLVLMPRMDYRIDRRFGLAWALLFVVTQVVNIIVEAVTA